MFLKSLMYYSYIYPHMNTISI